MLSKYCKDIVDRYDIKIDGVKKLIPNLYDKVKYVVHYKNLKYYLSLGMKLKRFHRILKFMSQKIIDKNFVVVHCKKRCLTLTKPINIGFCILELSKLLMYQFHYDYVLKTFDARFLFTETDSLVYEIRGSNVYDQCRSV